MGRIAGRDTAVRSRLCQTWVIVKRNERSSWISSVLWKKFVDHCLGYHWTGMRPSCAITLPRSPGHSRSPSVLRRPGRSGGISHGKRLSMSLFAICASSEKKETSDALALSSSWRSLGNTTDLSSRSPPRSEDLARTRRFVSAMDPPLNIVKLKRVSERSPIFALTVSSSLVRVRRIHSTSALNPEAHFSPSDVAVIFPTRIPLLWRNLWQRNASANLEKLLPAMVSPSRFLYRLVVHDYAFVSHEVHGWA